MLELRHNHDESPPSISVLPLKIEKGDYQLYDYMKTNGFDQQVLMKDGNQKDIENVFLFSAYKLGGAIYYPFNYEKMLKNE